MVGIGKAFCRAAIATVLFANGPGAGAAAPAEAGGPDAAGKKQQMVSAAARIRAASAELSRLWPGYWPEDQAFIIQAPGEGALLVSSAPAPAGLEPLPGTELPPPLQGVAWYRPGTLPGSARPFTMDYPIGQARGAMLVNFSGGVEQLIGTLLHEQFHAFQRSAFKPSRGGQFVDPLAIRDRVSFATAAEIEQRVLAAALRSSSERERRAHLQTYFALRREREARLPPAVAAVERGFERSEGSAEYVERLAYAKFFGEGEATLPKLLAERLERPFQHGAPYMTQLFRHRGYGVGSALIWFVARYGAKDWRSRIEGGAAPDELLEERIGRPKPAEAARLARQGRADFGYEARRASLAPAIRAAEKSEIKSIDEFLALAPFRLEVAAAALGKDARPGFSATNMTQLTASVMALPVAQLFSVSGPKLSLVVREKPVLMESQAQRYSILLPELPQVGGRMLPVGEHEMDQLDVRAPGVELRIERPVIVTVDARSLSVKALPE